MRLQSNRDRVLAVLAGNTNWVRGHDLARAAGLTHKQTIDALNSLLNGGLILRKNHKSTALWGALTLKDEPVDDSFKHLEQCWHRVVNRS
jgi:hypothetical protein